MRIITGKYKGRNLLTVDGRTTRPTTAYNRAMIFNVYSDLAGKRVLDLFAGTGFYGLEALSRGAEWVDLVEFATPAVAVILKNVALLGCGDDCHVWRKRADAFLKGTDNRWDVIFLDPPYAKNLLNPCLDLIYQRGLLLPDGVAIAEHSPQEPVAEAYQELVLKVKTGRSSCFTLLRAEEK